MKNLFFRRITLIWLILAGATLLSWEMGHGVFFRDIRFASSFIIVLALIKSRYIILEFMELRRSPLRVRVVAETWAAVVCLTLIGLYWAGTAGPD